MSYLDPDALESGEEQQRYRGALEEEYKVWHERGVSQLMTRFREKSVAQKLIYRYFPRERRSETRAFVY